MWFISKSILAYLIRDNLKQKEIEKLVNKRKALIKLEISNLKDEDLIDYLLHQNMPIEVKELICDRINKIGESTYSSDKKHLEELSKIFTSKKQFTTKQLKYDFYPNAFKKIIIDNLYKEKPINLILSNTVNTQIKKVIIEVSLSRDDAIKLLANDNVPKSLKEHIIDKRIKTEYEISSCIEEKNIPEEYRKEIVITKVNKSNIFKVLRWTYGDRKEFLIELGYYTKAEFEYIETNVLEWFIPDYIPETEAEIVNWKQNREEDALKYGAIIYPTEIGEDGKATHIGIDAGCDVIAPGNCRVVEKSDTSITIEFDGISQPEIGALDRYTMIIEGIEISGVPVEVQKQDGSSGGSKTIDELVGTTDVILAKQVIGKTGTNAVQVILKNSRGGYIDNIEDYMAPGLDTYNAQVADIARFYFIPYEGRTPGCVSNPSSEREVAVGIGQWTSYGATNNVPYACKMLYEKDPVFCKELKTFIGWTTEQVCADYIDGGGQLVAAFQTIEDRDKEKFMQLQMELLIEEKTQLLNNRGFAWLEERNPVTIGTVWSLYNWGPNMGWENHFDESMTDEQIIISLFKYASTQNSSDGSLNDRWNSQARLALEILDGTFTDIEGWINNKDAYPEYNEGSNPGYLSTK